MFFIICTFEDVCLLIDHGDNSIEFTVLAEGAAVIDDGSASGTGRRVWGELGSGTAFFFAVQRLHNKKIKFRGYLGFIIFK